MTDPTKTKKQIALSEAQRHQEHIDKMSAPGDLQSLVKQCLDDDSAVRPPISDVSDRMRRMKKAESVRCPHVNITPLAWHQVEQTTEMLKKATIIALKAKIQVKKAEFVKSF